MRKPFYKKSHKCWYVKSPVEKEIRLHPDKDTAWRIWEESRHEIEATGNDKMPPGGVHVCLETHRPPAIPSIFVPFTREAASSIPKGPGVYVVLDQDMKCKYVGKSVNMRGRAIHQKHEKIDRSTNYISWVTVPKELLLFVESYLIGILRPYDNFTPIPPERRRTYASKTPVIWRSPNSPQHQQLQSF